MQINAMLQSNFGKFVNRVDHTQLGCSSSADAIDRVILTATTNLGDDPSDAPDGGAQLLDEKHVPALLTQIECVVVQASYRSALTDAAHVVLPATIWCEKSGTITNLEGRQLSVWPVLPAAGEARDDQKILETLFL
jgi:NADH dehydrogenase/NADH:ubiquinone oxidoreductase subunit G